MVASDMGEKFLEEYSPLFPLAWNFIPITLALKLVKLFNIVISESFT